MRVGICMIALCLAAAALLSCGQDKTTANEVILTGRVTAEDTTVYLGGVKVYEASHNQGSTVTDSAGYFRLENVSFEEHNIYFEKDGYQPDTLLFEYTGTLEHPIVTRLIKLRKIEEP